MSQGVSSLKADSGLGKAPILELFEYVEVPWTADGGGMDLAGLGIRDVDDRKPAGDREEVHPHNHSQTHDWDDTGRAGSTSSGMGGSASSSYRDVEGLGGTLTGSHSQVGPGWDAEGITSLLAEERARGEQSGFERGFEEGLRRSQEQGLQALSAEKKRLRQQAAEMVEGFATSQSSYFHQVEQETVRLALSVAARILRRESQSDPLLLTGSVRAALGQLQQATTVRIRVPAEDRELWRESVNLIPRLAVRPEVIGDEQLSGGECRIETELGLANLGLWSQLTEIEKIFFDRHPEAGGAAKAAGRPGTAS